MKDTRDTICMENIQNIEVYLDFSEENWASSKKGYKNV
jgi:hypothetical protein